jgi:hypothetical protein
VPSLGLWSARARVKLNRWVEAAERYLEVTRLPVSSGELEVQQKAQAEASAELDSLKPRIPRLILAVQGASVENIQISIDGHAIAAALIGESQPIDPGSHRIRAASGGVVLERTALLAEGAEERVTLDFAASSKVPTASAAGSSSDRGSAAPTRTLGWIAIGVGGAGVLVGTVSGIMAVGDRTAIDDNPACGNDTCPTTERELVDRYNSLRTVSSICLIGGAAVAAAGAVLVLTAPKTRAPEVTLRLGPASATLGGRFW